MSCKICGRSACASWMHSAEQQEAWELVEVMDDRQLKSEVVDLRSEVSALKVEVADDAIALRDMMRERDAAEAELAVERAIVSRVWVQLGSPTYAQLKGRSIYCLIDEMKAELAADRARLDWLLSRMAGLVLPANKCVAWTVDVYDYQNRFPSRAAIDAAMKEGAK